MGTMMKANRMSLVPKDFKVPEGLETDWCVIRKLCFADTDLDYEAVMSSIDIIKTTRGGDWPTPELTYVDDQIDLAWHQREFELRKSFAYTVVSLDEKECLGCLYIYEGGYRGDTTKDAEADVSFWVTQKAYDQGYYPKLYAVLDNWLKTAWPFKSYAYSNVVLPN